MLLDEKLQQNLHSEEVAEGLLGLPEPLEQVRGYGILKNCRNLGREVSGLELVEGRHRQTQLVHPGLRVNPEGGEDTEGRTRRSSQLSSACFSALEKSLELARVDVGGGSEADASPLGEDSVGPPSRVHLGSEEFREGLMFAHFRSSWMWLLKRQQRVSSKRIPPAYNHRLLFVSSVVTLIYGFPNF